MSIPRKKLLSQNLKWLQYNHMHLNIASIRRDALHVHVAAADNRHRFLSTKCFPSYVLLCVSAPQTIGMPTIKAPSLHFSIVNHVRMQSTTMTVESTCWSCGHSQADNKGFLICPACNAVQALNPTMTHFQIFDLDQKFELDVKELEVKYKSLMKKLHPDLFHGKSMEERENSAQVSAIVTAVYNELLKPVSRATYLLKLRGIHVEEEGTVTDSEVIMEVMEIREALQSSPDKKTLEQLYHTAMVRMNKWSQAFNTALKEGNNTSAIGALQGMSYFGRVCDDIKRELL